MDQTFLTISEAAEIMRTPVNTLYAWRSKGVGPRACKVGRRLLYPRADLLAWIESQAA